MLELYYGNTLIKEDLAVVGKSSIPMPLGKCYIINKKYIFLNNIKGFYTFWQNIIRLKYIV